MRHGLVVAVAWVAAGCAPGPQDGASGAGGPSGVSEPPVMTAVGADPAVADPARALIVGAAREGVGIAVAVYRNGEPAWVEGVGYADRAAATPVDPETTRFRLYSVAKPMTAAAAGRLLERGRLDPTASIRTYVPGLPEQYAPITAMHLATHSSGIRHYAGEAEVRSRRHCESVADALEIFVHDPLVHAPGGGETYSSWGYVVLSAVIGAAAGAPFPAAMERLVFEPAGMEHMAIDDPTAEIAGRATSYAATDGAIEPADPVDNTCKWGAGAFVGTATDAAAFGAAMLDGTLLSEGTLQLFFRGSDTYDAMGVGAGGFAFLHLDRSTGVSVALVANTVGEAGGPAAQRAANEVVRLFGRR